VRFDTSGNTAWPLTLSSLHAGEIDFASQAGNFRFEFRGKKTLDQIDGTVDFADRHLPFAIRRLPSLPKPQNRVEAWQQDIAVLSSRFIHYDRSFSPKERDVFLKNLQTLNASLPNLPDQAVMVRLANTLALARNGHTRLYLMRNRTQVRQLPIRVWWFRDGLYIIRADRQNASLLGCQIRKIGPATTSEAFTKIEGIDAGSATWKRYMSSYFLTSPDILFGAGVIPSSDEEQLTVSCKGKDHRVTLIAPPLQKTDEPDEVWHDLAPTFDDHGLIPALHSTNVPLYLQRPTENYWFDYLPQKKVLYLQYNRAQASPHGASPSQFKEMVDRAIEEKHPRALVFDLRFNTGGDGFIAEPLIKSIAAKTPQLRVFVITGRATFSAGIMATGQLREWAHATIAGEPVGDGLDFWAEGGNLILPNSGLAAHYANGFHNYSTRIYPNIQPFVRLTVDTLAPGLPSEPSWAEYLAGEDVPLQSIFNDMEHLH